MIEKLDFADIDEAVDRFEMWRAPTRTVVRPVREGDTISALSNLPQERVYLAGPMSGHEDFNQKAFADANDFLTDLGYFVFDPSGQINADNKTGMGSSEDYRNYLPIDFQEVARADFVAVLPEWEWSRGATMELLFATLAGVPIRPLKPDAEEPNNNRAVWHLLDPLGFDLTLIGEHMNNMGFYGVAIHKRK